MEGAKQEHSKDHTGATIPAPAVHHRSVSGLLGGATAPALLALPCTNEERQRQNGVVPGGAVGVQFVGGGIDVRRTNDRRTDVFLLDCKKSFGVLKYILIFAEPKGKN